MFKIRIMRGKIPLDSGIISQWVQFSAEKALAPHSSPLAWKVPWMQEPGGLQSMGLLGVGHDWATSLSLFTFMRWRRNGNPLQCSCLEIPEMGEPGGLPPLGSHRVGHDWSDLAAAAAAQFSAAEFLFHAIWVKLLNTKCLSQYT